MSVFARIEIPFVFLRSESSESEFRKIDVGFCQKSYHRDNGQVLCYQSAHQCRGLHSKRVSGNDQKSCTFLGNFPGTVVLADQGFRVFEFGRLGL